MKLRWIGLAGSLAAAASVAPLSAEEPALTDTETIDYIHAADNRMTVPVSIGGHGPYRFIVDTGSERTVISRELADRLSLDESGDVMLTSIVDVQQVPTVIIPRLDFGRRSMEEFEAPALARGDLGAAGMLGIDALEDQQVVFDFARRQMTMSRSGRSASGGRSDDSVIVVRARTRHGRMVLTDASIDGTRVYAIVDTGSPVTIGNMALRERLVRRGRVDPEQAYTLTAVTGATMEINYTVAERLNIGGVTLTELPVAFVDAELFRQLDLLDRPAILLGMNALSVFDQVSIDFANRRMRLQYPAGGVAPRSREYPLLAARRSQAIYSD